MEIDIVSHIKKEIIAFECKWTNQKIDNRVVYELENKTSKINNFAITKLGFFAKSGYDQKLTTNSKTNSNYLYYQLEDLYDQLDDN
ncbi:DUF234 domain-containing protein ['Melaleuca sp.' phytoplasma]|uniref:DUF234 domain-containing protein n=2 Tax=Candidatus Phytoplasma melaleucae TaxID=2982630 RepID=A0ABT9DDT5_9MOLU|nr:DUF234 domain-containing protein ['Melaleuca sp.' phytoplasma]